MSRKQFDNMEKSIKEEIPRVADKMQEKYPDLDMPRMMHRETISVHDCWCDLARDILKGLGLTSSD